MINVRMMYLRPGNLYKEFIVEETRQEINRTGRAVVIHSGSGSRMLFGCLANASAEDTANHSIPDHAVTHTITQPGKPRAKRTDRLVLGDRVFYICDVDDCGALGLATLYYAEERNDLK